MTLKSPGNIWSTYYGPTSTGHNHSLDGVMRSSFQQNC